MAVSTEYERYVVEQLVRVPAITTRRMFGGSAIYSDGYMFAIIGADRLYLKIDDTNRSYFEAAETEPLRPYGDERTMPYQEVPVDVLEDPDALAEWAERSIDVARRAKERKSRKRP